MIKKIFSHSIVYALGPQLPKLVGFLLLPLFTRYLTDIDFGIWGTISAYTLFFITIRDLGLLVPLFNAYVNHRYHWKWRWTHIFNFLFLWGILYTLVLGLLLFFIIPEEASDNRLIIIILYSTQSLFFDVVTIYGIRYLQLKENPYYISIASFTSGIFAIGTQYFFIVELEQGYMGWIYGLFITGLINSIFYLPLFFRKIYIPYFNIKYKYLKPLLKVGLPLIPHNYSSYLLNSSDRLVMDIYDVRTREIGLYNVAYIWGNYLEILGTAIGMAVGPIYLKIFAKKENTEYTIRSLTQFLQYSFLIGSFIIAIWMKELFTLFINNKEMQSAYYIAIVIVMSYSYRPLYWHVVNRLQYEEKTNFLWKLSFTAGVLNMALNLIFIPIFGFQVAALTTFVALLFLGFAGYHIRKFRKFDSLDHRLVLHFVLIITFGLLAYLMKDSDLAYKLVVSIGSVIIYVILITPHFNKLRSLKI